MDREPTYPGLRTGLTKGEKLCIPCSLETRGGHRLPWRLRREVTFELICEGCVGVYERDEEKRGSWSLEDILGCCVTMSSWVHAQGS